MKKHFIPFFIITLLGLLGFMGCTKNQNEKINTPNALVPSIMVNDVLYRISENREDKNLKIEADEADYLGRTTLAIPLSEVPVENGQSNYVEVGTPYIGYNGGIALLMTDNTWVLFEAWSGE